jgi:Xanthomonas XOO_2897-like deaminase
MVSPHAERLLSQLMRQLRIKQSQVKAFYSELEPCGEYQGGQYCSRFLTDMFPDADIYYSFEYGDTTAGSTSPRCSCGICH